MAYEIVDRVREYYRELASVPEEVCVIKPCGEGWVVKCEANEPKFFTNWCDAYQYYGNYMDGW